MRIVSRPWPRYAALTHLLQIFSPRYIFLGIMDGHDPYIMPIDFGVSRFKVKVTVTWSIKSLSTQ